MLNKVTEQCDNKETRMIWFNMRQEPVVYINCQPHAPRHPDKMHDNLEVTKDTIYYIVFGSVLKTMFMFSKKAESVYYRFVIYCL